MKSLGLLHRIGINPCVEGGVPMTFDYIAGFFDGEGCVMTYRPSRESMRHPQIYMSQKDPEVLEAIVAYLGFGRISPPRGEQVARLYVRKASNVKKFVDLILPHSIVKRRQLELVAELADLVGGGNRSRREQLAQQIKDLNHKRI